MAIWSVRSATETREGLNIYQVQELVRSGQLGPEDEASNGGPFKRVREIPPLARLIPGDKPPEVQADGSIVINGMRLLIGVDGKPMPPSANEIARMLATVAFDKDEAASSAKRWTIYSIAFVALGLLVLAGIVVIQSRPKG